MERQALLDLAVDVDRSELFEVLRMDWDPGDEDARALAAMLEDARAVARPKALFAVAPIEEKGEDFVVAAGVRLDSALVRRNLDPVHRIVPYIATCGTELDAWSQAYTDPLEQCVADEIKKLFLYKAFAVLRDRVRSGWFPQGDMSSMNPGSLPAWPLTQQRALFALLGDVTGDIGVRLTPSSLMLPSKSMSGFFFSAAVHYENCRLCRIPNCPGHRVPWEPGA